MLIISKVGVASVLDYHSVPGKRPRVLKCNLQFRSAWALTRDQEPMNCVRAVHGLLLGYTCILHAFLYMYGSCCIDHLKSGTWGLTHE